MHTTTPLHVLQLHFDVLRRVVPLVRAVARHDRALADQLKRALDSTGLNLAEGQGSTRGNRRARFETALGSAKEARYALQAALAWGYLDDESVAPIDHDLDRIAAMTFRLAHPKPR